MAMSMTVSGLVFAFIRGWSFALCILAVFPFLTIATSFMSKILQKGFMASMQAYSQSAGYAD